LTHDDKIDVIRKLISSGKVKTKGRYEVMPYREMGWHKNHSAMIVSLAALAEILNLDSVEHFIKEHKDPYDFFLRTKVPRNSRLVLVHEDNSEEPLQNICRYYPSTKGGKLVKIMPPLEEGGEDRRLGIDTEWNVVPCNNMKEFHWDIDYNYYIEEAKKLLDGVRNP